LSVISTPDSHLCIIKRAKGNGEVALIPERNFLIGLYSQKSRQAAIAKLKKLGDGTELNWSVGLLCRQ
jgi:hypothetical protein